MRILLVSPYFPPQNAVASLRTHAFARSWTNAGEQVTVLTTRKREDQQGLNLPVDGIDVIELETRPPQWLEWLRTWHKKKSFNDDAPSAGKSGAIAKMLRRIKQRSVAFGTVRMPDLTDYWVKPAVNWCRAHGGESAGSSKWDVVVSSSGPYTAHLAAMCIKRLGLAKRWVADFRDLWTANHIYRGLFPFTLRERFLERRCLRESDMLVTATDGLARTLGARQGDRWR